MPASPPSHATPEMLKWAREKASLSVAAVARAERVSEITLENWESGKEIPSFARLRRLAKRYKRPLMVFYLAAPPVGFTVVRDFRASRHGTRAFSPALSLAIRIAQERQAWAEESLYDEGAQPLEYVASKDASSSARDLAIEIRARLGVTTETASMCKSPQEAFNVWRSHLESIGCFVFQASGVDVREMRGFALPNRIAPAVVVNIRDSASARIFTMIHELCHVYLGQTAVTGAGRLQFAPNTDNPIEKFCNQVAAEVLVPSDDLKQRVSQTWKANEDEAIRGLAAFYKVSRAVIVIRLFETSLADREFVRRKFVAMNRPPKPARQRKGGPKRFQVILNRVGDSFARLVVFAYQSGSIHGGELSSLLGMRMQHLASLEKRLISRQQTGPP